MDRRCVLVVLRGTPVYFWTLRKRVLDPTTTEINKESISNWGLRGLLLNLRLLFSLHSRIPANEGLSELVIEYLRPHLE